MDYKKKKKKEVNYIHPSQKTELICDLKVPAQGPNSDLYLLMINDDDREQEPSSQKVLLNLHYV